MIQSLPFANNALAVQLFYTVLTLVITILIVKSLHHAIDRIAKTAGAAKHISLTPKQTAHYAKPAKILINLVAVVIVALILLGIFGMQGSVLAVLSAAGFLGIVVGFASKDMLSNLIAGFIIFLDQPFIIGDWIAVQGIEGVVVDMKVTSTRIRTFGGEIAAIPNSIIESEKIINKTHQGKLRVKAEVSIDYTSDTDKAIKLAKNFMVKSPVFLDRVDPSVYITELDDSAVKLTMRGWIDPNKQSAIEAKHVLLSAVKKLYKKNGIKIPFTQLEISKRGK